jgi:hypothetical protein
MTLKEPNMNSPRWNPNLTSHLSNNITLENLFRPWGSFDSSTLHPHVSVNERGGFVFRMTPGLRGTMGRKKRRFETEISAFFRDFGRIAASSFPYILKKCVILSLYSIFLHTWCYDNWLWKSQIWITPGETGGRSLLRFFSSEGAEYFDLNEILWAKAPKSNISYFHWLKPNGNLLIMNILQMLSLVNSSTLGLNSKALDMWWMSWRIPK